MDSNQLKNWGKANSPYIKLKDKESVTVTLKSFKPIIKDSFGEEKEFIRYIFQTEDGNTKTFDNGSCRLAEVLADCLGQKIVLTRDGEGQKTRYEVKSESSKEKPPIDSTPDEAGGPESITFGDE